jgi:hypothetical protein
MKVKRTVSITSNQYNIPQFVVKLQEWHFQLPFHK